MAYRIDTITQEQMVLTDAFRSISSYEVKTTNVGTKVNVRSGRHIYHFTLHLDGAWRLNSVSSYGNLMPLVGQRCDASGLPIFHQRYINELVGMVYRSES